jgi:DNA-binding transcriptional ArsR family regulator
MEEIAATFTVEQFDQLRAIADPLRSRIMEQLVQRPMTMSQLGELLGETTAKMHYHVRELEKYGFLRLVEKREHGGFIEKYYRAVARDIYIASDLLRTTPPSELTRTVQEYLEEMRQDIMRAITYEREHPESPFGFAWESDALWLTQEEHKALEKQLDALFKPFRRPQGRDDEHPWITHFIAHVKAPTETEEKGESEEPKSLFHLAADPLSGPKRTNNVS